MANFFSQQIPKVLRLILINCLVDTRNASERVFDETGIFGKVDSCFSKTIPDAPLNSYFINKYCNVQEALKSLGRRNFYQIYFSFVLLRTLSPSRVNVVLVFGGGSMRRGEERARARIAS